MDTCKQIPYKKTNFFSKIVVDFLDNSTNLHPFYNHQYVNNGLVNTIIEKQKNYNNRTKMVAYFKEIYSNKKPTTKQIENLRLLEKNNCFTITTAHQPNIFTGPLYFIFKIIHAIKLANDLSNCHSNYNFVPVYFMGSEDADLDELGTIAIQQKKISWKTNQTGAVGRMLVDDNFLTLITEIEQQIAVNEYGNELVSLFKHCYTKGETIANCTTTLVNTLFGKYGLLVFLPDSKNCKQLMVDVFEKELLEQFSIKNVVETNKDLSKHYKIQASGRDINLFYLINNNRERISFKNDRYEIENLNISFSTNEIINELKSYSERFSPNVILRPILQEKILPNLFFIGGGGELAYWLQLKKVFAAANVTYPLLMLRNSFILTDNHLFTKINKAFDSIELLFENETNIANNYVKKNSNKIVTLTTQIDQLYTIYNDIKTIATTIDATLETHVLKLLHQAKEKLLALEKKMTKAEKKKFDTQLQQMFAIKKQLFPNNNLQERTENFSYLYSIYGRKIIDKIYNNSQSISSDFCIVNLDTTPNYV
jgi:bacillithiol synthase